MFRSLLLLLLSLLLCGCGGGGGGSTSSQAEEAAGHRLQVRVNTGVINPQTIGPLSTITRVRVELLVFGTGSEYLPALEVPVDAANFSAVAVFSPVSQGRYTLRASGFNSMGTLVAGPITSDVDVAPGLSSAASLLLQVPPVEKDFLFVAAADEIHVFESDPTTGVLTPNASSPFAAACRFRSSSLLAFFSLLASFRAFAASPFAHAASASASRSLFLSATCSCVLLPCLLLMYISLPLTDAPVSKCAGQKMERW